MFILVNEWITKSKVEARLGRTYKYTKHRVVRQFQSNLYSFWRIGKFLFHQMFSSEHHRGGESKKNYCRWCRSLSALSCGFYKRKRYKINIEIWTNANKTDRRKRHNEFNRNIHKNVWSANKILKTNNIFKDKREWEQVKTNS
jgi:hypothetical protein